MSQLKVGKRVPDFSLPATGDSTESLSAHHGRNVVLYFYPKDNTPGCTREGQEFRDQIKRFAALNTDVIGVSRDSVESHEKFKSQQKLPFPLISDPDELLCKKFDVIREKNLYGRKVLGVERSTFLIDDEGILRQEWRKVKVDGHVEAVLQAIKEL